MKFQIEGLKSLNEAEVLTSINCFEPGDMLAYGMSLDEMAPKAEATESNIMECSRVASLVAGCLAIGSKYGLYMDGRYIFTSEIDALDPDLENHGDYYLLLTVERDDDDN